MVTCWTTPAARADRIGWHPGNGIVVLGAIDCLASIPDFPVDDVPQGGAVRERPQVFAKDIDCAVPVFIAAAGNMRGDQYPRVAPKRLHRRAFEFAHVYIQHD